MPDYAEQIPPQDRWAIIAYVRALQLSQHAPLKELPQPEQAAAVDGLGAIAVTNHESIIRGIESSRISLRWGTAGWILFAAGAFIRPAALWQGYLVAFNFWLGIALGSLVILWVHCLTSGNWGNVIRRVLEACASTVPLLAIGFVPLLFGLHDLYPWMNPEIVAQEPSIQHKVAYLNESFFTARAAIYFALWIALAVVTVRWSQAEDQAADKRAARRLRLLAGPGLVLYGLTITFASVDWVMSLQPRWYSTIFPVVFAIGQVLGAMAFSIIAWIALSWANRHHRPRQKARQTASWSMSIQKDRRSCRTWPT